MPDIIDASGITVKTVTEIVTELEADFRAIYGNDINIDQNSPDGQLLNIFAQAGVDVRELLVSNFNSFDPDNAVGRPLDQRVVINNIRRQGGTFTTQAIDVTVDRNVTLQGLDANFADPDATGYTVQDDAGNQFILVDTTMLTPGLTALNFRAREIGRVETTIGTITNQNTVVLGVTSVNNSTSALQTGTDEETDLELRVRRERSTALGSTGFVDGLRGGLLNIDTVTDAVVFENFTDVIDADGIPAHGIWVIVEGGANTDIANEIFIRKTPGTNMRGLVSIPVTSMSGQILNILFDRPTASNLFIRFDIQPTVPSATFDEVAIKQFIEDNLSYTIGEPSETQTITCLARDALAATGGSGIAVNVEVSDDDITYVDFLQTMTLDEQFVVDVSRITITVL